MSAAQVITSILTTQAANLKAYYPGSQMTVAVDGQRVGDLVDLSGNGKHLTSQFASTYNVAGLAGESVTPECNIQ